jgi:hypothetical protein
MIVEAGKERNFCYQLPETPEKPGKWFVIPSALQMGWTNSPAYFCFATKAAQVILQWLLALTLTSSVIPSHEYEAWCSDPPGEDQQWSTPSELSVFLRVFVDDFVQAVAGPKCQTSKNGEQVWVARAALHAIHSIFPSPHITQHKGGRDSILLKKTRKQ